MRRDNFMILLHNASLSRSSSRRVQPPHHYCLAQKRRVMSFATASLHRRADSGMRGALMTVAFHSHSDHSRGSASGATWHNLRPAINSPGYETTPSEEGSKTSVGLHAKTAMPYSQLFYHIVWSTKNREPLLILILHRTFSSWYAPRPSGSVPQSSR